MVGIIGIIAAILLPYFVNALQKTRQKRTMAEMHETGKAMTTWFLDQVSGAAAGASTGPFDMSDYGAAVSPDVIEELLVPVYLSHLERHDAWGNPFEYFLRSDRLQESDDVMAIRSPGDDGNFASSYVPGPFRSTSYGEDIVWADGTFVHWPQN